MGGRDDAGLDRHDLADPPGGAGRLRDLVPHFRQLPERARAEHGEQHELRQRASGHPVRDHLLRAEPEHDDHAAESEEQGGCGDEGARLGHGPRRLVSSEGGVAIAAGGEPLGQKRLHDAHRRQAFGREGGRVRESVLGAAGTLTHRAPGRVEREHDDGNGGEHESRQFRARHHHHRDRADEQKQVAQRERRRGAECRLELGRVCGEARRDVAGLLRVEKAGVEARQMGEEVGAKVSDHAFAERHHQVIARARGQREHRDDPDHSQKIGADDAGVGRRKAEVDHPPDRDRHDQRRARGDRQGDQRQHDPGPMGERVRRKRLERAEGDARSLAAVGGERHCAVGSSGELGGFTDLFFA